MEEDKPVKEKGFFGKVKDIAEDKEHQIIALCQKNQQQKHEKTNLAFSSVSTQHS